MHTAKLLTKNEGENRISEKHLLNCINNLKQFGNEISDKRKPSNSLIKPEQNQAFENEIKLFNSYMRCLVNLNEKDLCPTKKYFRLNVRNCN